MNPNQHNSNEHDSMSDARLDELLGLAEPQPDRACRRRVQLRTRQILRSTRIKPVFDFRWAGVAVAMASLGFLVWFNWNADPKTGPIDIAKSKKISEPLLSGDYVVTYRRRKPKVMTRKVSLEKGVTFEATVRWMASSELATTCFSKTLKHIDQRCYEELAKKRKTKRRRNAKVAQTWAADWLDFREKMESKLERTVKQSDRANAVAAFKLLGHVGSRKQFLWMLRHWNQPELRPAIVVAAGRWADVKTLERLILNTEDATRRTKLMGNLLCDRKANGFDLFLKLTAEHALYREAQIAGENAVCLPTNQLLKRLHSNRVAIARAAAATLSKRSEPGIHEYLVRLADQQKTAHVAVMALTARQDASSVALVNRALQDRRWSATFTTAKRKWHRLLADPLGRASNSVP